MNKFFLLFLSIVPCISFAQANAPRQTSIETSAEECVFSYDGSKILSWNDSDLYVWRVEDGTQLLHFERSDSLGSLIGASFSHDDSKIVATYSKTIRIWDASTGQLIASNNIYSNGAVFTKDDKMLFVTLRNSKFISLSTSNYSSNTVNINRALFDWQKNEFIGLFSVGVGTHSIKRIVSDVKGERILLYGGPPGLDIYSTNTGFEFNQIELDYSSIPSSINLGRIKDIKFVNGGENVLISQHPYSGINVVLCNSDMSEVEQTYEFSSVPACFSNDATLFVSYSGLFHFPTGERAFALPEEIKKPFAISNDNRWLATGGTDSIDIWDISAPNASIKKWGDY